MEDLNFSDFNRQMISKNGIKKTYMMAKRDSFLEKKMIRWALSNMIIAGILLEHRNQF